MTNDQLFSRPRAGGALCGRGGDGLGGGVAQGFQDGFHAARFAARQQRQRVLQSFDAEILRLPMPLHAVQKSRHIQQLGPRVHEAVIYEGNTVCHPRHATGRRRPGKRGKSLNAAGFCPPHEGDDLDVCRKFIIKELRGCVWRGAASWLDSGAMPGMC